MFKKDGLMVISWRKVYAPIFVIIFYPFMENFIKKHEG